jgi:orotidine-5'-phosphate decarboxylase
MLVKQLTQVQDILVIGRPITMANDPAEAAYKIFKSL